MARAALSPVEMFVTGSQRGIMSPFLQVVFLALVVLLSSAAADTSRHSITAATTDRHHFMMTANAMYSLSLYSVVHTDGCNQWNTIKNTLISPQL